MKKVLLLSLLFYYSISFLNAQSTHLTFKEIPIDGNISFFVEKMKKIGFIPTMVDETYSVMEGSFVNKQCKIYILASPKTKTVWKVAVSLPKDNSWYSLKSDYFNYKEQYQNKYGTPSDKFEFFVKPYYEGDGYELQALDKDKCHYSSYFTIDNGTIIVEISSSPAIRFSYEDKANAQLAQSEKESQVQNDI